MVQVFHSLGSQCFQEGNVTHFVSAALLISSLDVFFMTVPLLHNSVLFFRNIITCVRILGI